jgi:cysteine-rich repeat protein
MSPRSPFWSSLLLTSITLTACASSNDTPSGNEPKQRGSTKIASKDSSKDAGAATAPASADGATGFIGLGPLPQGCTTNCTDAGNVCGDSVLGDDEACDDGNTKDGDGCD